MNIYICVLQCDAQFRTPWFARGVGSCQEYFASHVCCSVLQYVAVCCTPWFARDVGSRQEACRKSCVLPTLVEERAYNICQVQRSVRFVSSTYSETRIIARESHSIFWKSDHRQRLPKKWTKKWIGVTVLKFPLSPLHSTRGLCCSVLQCVAGRGLLVESEALKCYAESYVCCNVLQCVAVCCNMLQCAAAYCSVLQRVTVCCNVL